MTHKTFLPSIHNGPTVPVQGEADDRARAIFELMSHHQDQGREFKAMVWDEKLAYIARIRCFTQAKFGWDGHVDPKGKGPNWWVRNAGYPLPDDYDQADDANNIESLAHNGNGTPEQVWKSWMQSNGHRVHILGANDFYSGQTQVGVGYYFLESSTKKHYWCVLTCHPEVIA